MFNRNIPKSKDSSKITDDALKNNDLNYKDMNRYKGSLRKKSKDSKVYPQGDFSNYVYSTGFGSKNKVNIYVPIRSNHPLNQETLACILDRVYSNCGKHKAAIKEVILDYNGSNFNWDSMNRKPFYGFPLTYNRSTVRIGVYTKYNEVNPRLSLNQYYGNVEKAIYGQIIHNLCTHAKEQIKEVENYSPKDPHEPIKNPYEKYIVSGLKEIIKNKAECDKVSTDMIKQVNGVAQCVFYDLEKIGVMYFTNPDKLKSEHPEYYAVIQRLAQKGEGGAYYSIEREYQKKYVEPPKQVSNKTQNQSAFDYYFNETQKACQRWPELSEHWSYVNTYLGTGLRIDNYGDVSMFYDWLEQYTHGRYKV